MTAALLTSRSISEPDAGYAGDPGGTAAPTTLVRAGRLQADTHAAQGGAKSWSAIKQSWMSTAALTIGRPPRAPW